MTTLEDFIDASDIDFEPPPELRERINETLVELNSDLCGEDDGNGGGITGNPPNSYASMPSTGRERRMSSKPSPTTPKTRTRN